MAKFIPNPKLRNYFINAFANTAYAYHKECQRVITTPGIFPGFKGDIVQTGALLRSQRLTLSGSQAIIIWTARHAGKIFKRRNVPGYALVSLPLVDRFADEVKKQLGGD